MRKMNRSIAVAGVAVSLGAGAWAAGGDAQKVLSDLHHSNQMEIHMGQMAKEKGASDAVRAYGEQLMKDHAEADKQVLELSQKDSIALLAASDTGEKMEASLSNKTGAAFDQAFAEQMEKDHKKDISKMEKAQKTLPPSDVRDLVTKVLPVLRAHLAIAEKIEKKG